jgi:hypothetical protein
VQEDAASKQNKYEGKIENVPDAEVPTKFILITHSMGNMAARLYIYSNELAGQGKYFDKGFYKGDVEKVVCPVELV